MRAKGQTGQFGDLCRHALGDEVELGEDSALFLAAARIRYPGQDDARALRPRVTRGGLRPRTGAERGGMATFADGRTNMCLDYASTGSVVMSTSRAVSLSRTSHVTVRTRPTAARRTRWW